MGEITRHIPVLEGRTFDHRTPQGLEEAISTTRWRHRLAGGRSRGRQARQVRRRKAEAHQQLPNNVWLRMGVERVN